MEPQMGSFSPRSSVMASSVSTTRSNAFSRDGPLCSPSTVLAADASTAKTVEGEHKGPSLEKAFDLVVETLEAITEERGGNEPIWGSMIKQAIKRRHPGFNERAHGFRSFNDLLLEAQKRGLLRLEADEKSGGYTVRTAE